WEDLTEAEREIVKRIIAPEHHAYRIRAERAEKRLLRTKELLEKRLSAYNDLKHSGDAVPGRQKAELARWYAREIASLSATLQDDLDQLRYLVKQWEEAEKRGFRQAYVVDELPTLDILSREHMRILVEDLDRNIEGWMHHRGFDRGGLIRFLRKLRRVVAPVRRHRKGAPGWEEDVARSMYEAIVGLREQEIKNKLGEYLEQAATIPKAPGERTPPPGYHPTPYKLQFGPRRGEEVWIKKHIYDDWVREIERPQTGSPDPDAQSVLTGADEYLDSLMRFWTKNQLIAMQSVVNNLSGFMLVALRSMEHLNRAILAGSREEAKRELVRFLRYPAAMMQSLGSFVREAAPYGQALFGPVDVRGPQIRGMGAIKRTALGAGVGAAVGQFLDEDRERGALAGAVVGAGLGQVGAI